MVNIYVGNLAYTTTENDLRNEFAKHGEVARASIVKDRDSGRSKGFGFVEMPDSEAAKKAIDACNGLEIDGRALRVNEARPREDRPSRGPRGGNGGGYNRR